MSYACLHALSDESFDERISFVSIVSIVDFVDCFVDRGFLIFQKIFKGFLLNFDIFELVFRGFL